MERKGERILSEEEKLFIEKNMKTIEIGTKKFMNKYNIQMNEYEEYFQRACLAVCNKMHKYDRNMAFSTFVGAVLENALIDIHRKESRNIVGAVSIEECYMVEDGELELSLGNFLTATDDTENDALSRIVDLEVKKCIKYAKEKCTSNVVIRGFEALELKIAGYTGTEIARIYNVPSNSVRAWISRAKKVLAAEREFKELLDAL